VTRILTLKEIYERVVLQDDQPNINVGKFGKQYCTIPLRLLKSIIELYEHNKECCSEILEGLQHFIPVINDYFSLMVTFKKNIQESEITLILFESFTLPNKEKVRATKSYYNAPIFSDIAVYMDPEQDFNTFGGYCFAKVLLFVRVILTTATMIDLALICWYDFKYPSAPSKFYKYECPHLQLTKIYNMIPVQSINHIVHIVP
ncbi:1723_t:CDS:2, partial [Cetraspora pellucida]